MLDVCIGIALLSRSLHDILTEWRGTKLYSWFVVYFLYHGVVKLGYTQIILMNIFVREPELATETESPAI